MAAVVLVPPDVPKIVPHDPKDDPIVLTAIVGQAAVLCTLDKHLYAQPVVNFCGTHNIRILTDVTLLKELKSS